MKILVTGAAGFIGFHLSRRLLNDDFEVVGLDNINNYYDTDLKYARLKKLGINSSEIVQNKITKSSEFSKFKFIRLNLEDRTNINDLFYSENFDIVYNLAAQAGVRHSLTNPLDYVNSNITGFANMLEACRETKIQHLIYASSSSVYGLNETIPFSTSDNVDHPINMYAATKKTNELMAHAYSYLYKIPTTGLRFFTVYGPWGRPDMAYFLFTKSIIDKQPIRLFNEGNMKRDFTYIDDITECLRRIINYPPEGNQNWSGIKPDPSCSKAPYKIYNIGNSNPVHMNDFIHEIEKNLGQPAIKELYPMQPGEMNTTWANVDDLFKEIKYKPQINIEEGVKRFIQWYKDEYSSF